MKKPRGLAFPQKHNKSTRVCGVSDTYSIEARNSKNKSYLKKYTKFSIYIAPKKTSKRNYVPFNKDIKFEEACVIRVMAVKAWPDFTYMEANHISRLFYISKKIERYLSGL